MILTKIYLKFLLIFIIRLRTTLAGFHRICYFTNWAQSRPTGGEFYPEDINPELCSHLIYAFATIENYDLAPTENVDPGFDEGPGFYTRIMALKLMNPSLKILLAVGGWAQGSYPFDAVVESEQTMQRFANNAVKYLRKWEFDGLDVDWEFPIVKKSEFTKLLEALRIAFDTETAAGKDSLLLTIAVSAGQATIDTSYEINKISPLVDFVNLMAYDFNGGWGTKTGFHSALFSGSADMLWEKTLNADWAVNYWIKNGCPKEKLILGVAFYGRGFILKNENVNQVGSPTKGSSKAGQFTRESGVLSYYEICDLINKNNLVEKFDTEYRVPSVQNGAEWISYENQQSLMEKANYVKDQCLGGFMIWAADFDDFKGKYCNQGSYPLLNALNNVLKDTTCTSNPPLTTEKTTQSTQKTTLTSKQTSKLTSTVITQTQSQTTSKFTTKLIPTTPVKTTETTSEITGACNGNTFVPSPNGCEYYQVCLKGFMNPVATLKCPNSHWFDPQAKTCVLDTQYKCLPNNKPDENDNNNLKPDQIESKYKCPGASGLFPNNQDCKKFWHCSNNIPYPKSCPGNLVFNDELSTCAWTSRLCNKSRNVLSNLIVSNYGSWEFTCPTNNGLFKNNKNCNSYWECVNNTAVFKFCPENLVFNEIKGLCDQSTCTLNN